MANFTTDDLAALNTADLEKAKALGFEILAKCNNMDARKISYLRNRIEESVDPKNIVSLFWNMLLAGEKLFVHDSSYRSKF